MTDSFKIVQEANIVDLEDEDIVANLVLDVNVGVMNPRKYALRLCPPNLQDPTETNSGDNTVVKIIYEELNGESHTSEFLFRDDQEVSEFTNDSMPNLILQMTRTAEFNHPNIPDPDINSTYICIKVMTETTKTGHTAIKRIGSLLAKLESDATKKSLVWLDQKNQNRLMFSRRLVN